MVFACVGACLGSCAATSVCKACSSCAPKTNNTAYQYAFLTLIVSTVAIILQMFGHRKTNGFKICGWIGDEENCQQNASPFRILSTLSWFYLIHIVMTRIWASFHKSFWLIKVLLFTIAVIITYFIPNSFFEGYAVFGIIGASIFIVLQIVIFINMCYDWNETWVSREWFNQTIIVTVMMYVSAGILYGIGFARYGRTGCSSNQANLSCSVIVSCLLSLLSIYAPHGAILPSAGVTLYLSWILFSGLSYVEDEQCNTVLPNNYTKVISMVIMCVGIGYFCLSNYSGNVSESETETEQENNTEEVNGEDKNDTEMEKGKKKKKDDAVENVTDIKMTVDDVDIDEKNDDDDDDKKGSLCSPSDPIQAKNIHFYILMFFGCLYIMMVMTKWETKANGMVVKEGKSDKIVVANIIAHWMVAVLYLITLIAPIMCPNRFIYDDFDDTD